MNMNALLITNEKVDFLDNLYSKFDPQLFKVELIGTVSVFSFIFESEEILNKNWGVITNSIASYYQSEFEKDGRDFEKWNIYILFLVKNPVSIQLKYKIENDKFSSRKIVQDNLSENINEDFIKNLINKHIVINDIDMFETDNAKSLNRNSAYSNNSKIYGLIENNNSKIYGRGNKKEKLDNLYQQIIKEIRDEIQKSRNTSI